MSNEFKVGVKLHVDSTQYTAEFTKAGHTAQAFAAQVSGSASSAATGIQSITGKLDGLGHAATNGNTAAAAIDKITQSGRQAAGALGAIPQPLTGAAANFQAAQTGLAGVARQGDAVKTALSGGTPAAQALGAAAASASQQAAKAGGVAQAALGQTTLSAKQTAAALRGVPAQFTDIITSIQGGQAPLTVFLQQGGQLKDMFGGAGPAARALGGYVAGLVNPFTAAAAVVGVLALGYYKGSQEADGYRAAILMSGNAAGTTVGQLADMARAISEVTGTQGAAAAALTQMAGSGAVARENLQQFAQTAMGLEKYVGQPVKATVDHLEQLGKAPLQASTKLNEQYHHLTVAVYEQIRALEEQGRKEEAGAAAQQAYMTAMEARKNEMAANLGSIERAWNAVTGAAKGAWDAMLNVGRPDTLSTEIANVRQKIDQAKGLDPNRRHSMPWDTPLAELEQQLANLTEQERMLRRGAEAQAERARQVEHEAAWGKIVTANKSKEKQQEEEILRIRNAGKAAGKEQVEIEREIAAYKARVADKGAAGAASRELERQRSLLAELAGLSGDFYKDWESLNKQFKEGKLTAEQLTQEQEKLLAKQPVIKKAREDELKVMQAQFAVQQQIADEIAQAEVARSKEVYAGRAAVAEYSKQVDEATRYLQVERDTVNATASSRALSIELLRIQIDLEKQLEAIRTNSGFTQADRDEQTARALAVAAQARANATARAELAHTRELGEELKRITEQYEQGLTNAAMQGGKSLREYIKGMLRTTAFRIVLDPIMKPLAGLLASVTGSGSTATSAASGGGIMGTANLLSSAYSALTTGVSSSITAGFAKLAGSSFGQAIGLSNPGAIVGNNPSAFVPAGGQLTELGQSLSTGLGMLGNGLAGYGISSAISNGYTTGGNTVNVLSGIASAFFGPLAGVVGGLINRAFGRKLKDTGIEGTIGGSAGFEGNSYQFYKGGWLRSDKTVRGDLDAGVDKSLDTAVKQMQLSMAGLATSIGAPTEAISSFSQAIKVSFNGLDEAGIQEKVKEALADYNEGLASAFIASVDRSELPKWVDRLMGNVDASAVERLQAIADYPAKLLQSFGTSRDQLAQLYAEGLASGDTAAVGQAVANSLVASIEASMLGNASAQVFDIVNQGIVTPMLDAIVMGQNVSEALSEASIQKTIERAKETAAAFAELWNNAEFTAALEDIRTTVGSALGNAGAAMDYIPRYTQAVTDSGSAASTAAGALQGLQTETARLNIELLKAQGNAAAAAAAQRALDTAGFDDAAIAAYDLNAALRAQIDATNAAADAARQVAEERAGLESTLLQLLGDTTELRARELAALDASNRAIQQHIWAVQDSRAAYEAASSRAQSAYSAVERSASAQKSELQKQLDAEKAAVTARVQAARSGNEAQIAAARETASAIKGIASSLSAAVRTVQAESTAINFARLQNARSVLEGARGAADLSKVAGLESAIGVVGKDTTEFYATFEEWSYAQGVTAGTLRDLDSKAQAQLTTAEAIVQALGAQNDVAKALADAEIAAAEERFRIETGILDDTLNNAKQQLNALLGIDEGVLSMEAALGQFGAATSALAQQAAAAAGAAAQAAATAASSAASAMKEALSGLGASISSAIGGGGSAAASKPSTTPATAPTGLPPGTPWGVAQSPDAILGASKYTDADLRAMGFNPADLLAYTQLSQQSGVQGGLDSVVDNILRQGDDALRAAYGLQHLPNRTGPNGEVYTTLTDKTGKTYDSMKAWADSFTNAQRAAASEAWTNSAAGNGINPQELQTILQIGSTADRQLYWAGGSLDMGGFAAQDGKHYSSAAIVDAINTVLSQGASVQDVLNAGQANFGLNEEDIRTAARAAGIPGFAVGINRVPHDMLALIHEDEAVLPARFNPFNPNAPRLGGNDSTAEQLQELRRTVEQLVALMAANNDYTRRHADQFDKVTAGGNAMAMEAL